MAHSIYDFSTMAKGPLKSHNATVIDALPDKHASLFAQSPSVGVIHNPRSHRNRHAAQTIAQIEREFGPNIHIAEPSNRSALPEALAQFAKTGIDLLVINGGDGTVRDVLTCGHAVFGSEWPALAFLPRGKTNALAYDLGLPASWSLDDAVQAYKASRFEERRALAVTSLKGRGSAAVSPTVYGFILGAGAFTKATQAGQSAHRLGAFNALAVVTTAIWALVQSVTASRSNPWRKGARMQIGIGPQNAPLGHSGHGDPAYRQMLFASSLEQLPGGIRPFGAVQAAGPAQFKMLAIDQISRRTTALIPAMLAGWVTRGLRRRGVHQLAVSSLTLTLDQPFIVDGESFPAGDYLLETGPHLRFTAP